MHMRLLAICAALLLGGCDLIPFSGGPLQGTLTPAPADWTQAASADVIQLESNPAEPYLFRLHPAPDMPIQTRHHA